MVRKLISECLQDKAQGTACDKCQQNAAFELAFCHYIGFAFEGNQEIAAYWAELGGKEMEDLEDEIDEVTDMLVYRNKKVKQLGLDGFSMIMDHVNEYRQPNYELTQVQTFYKREIEDLTQMFPDQPLITVTQRATLATILHGAGQLRDAEIVYRELIQFYEQHSDDDRTNDTLKCKTFLADILREQGRLFEAEQLGTAVLTQREAGNDGQPHRSPDTIESIASLASTLYDANKWDEAMTLFKKALLASQIVFGDKHPRTLTAMSNLACACRETDLAEAEALDHATLLIKREILDDGARHHYSTVTSMANLALTYSRQHRWQEAEKLELQVLEARMEHGNLKHPAVLTAMSNLAMTYHSQGRYEVAEELQVKVVRGRREVLGPTHRLTIEVIDMLADTYASLGRHSESESLRNHGC